MKNNITFIISALLIGWISGCNFVKPNKAASETTDDAYELMSNEPQNENYAKVMEVYKAILRNDMTFFSTENKKNYKLSEFNFDAGSESDTPLKAQHFTFINLYGDDIPTLVVELSSGFDGVFEVLRYQEGVVYGFNFSYRALLDLTNDGTSFGSSGASDGGFYRISVNKDSYAQEELGYSKSKSDGSTSYFIGDKNVTKSAYDTFAANMWESMGKNKAVWYDYADAELASISNSSPDNLPTLLRNRGKCTLFSHVAEHGGKVYASEFQCLPEWISVAGVTHPTGGFAVVGDALVYYCHPGYTSYSPISLYRSDLRGGNVTEITNKLDNMGNVWAAGDRVIYSTLIDEDLETISAGGVFWYDVKTSRTTRLLPMPYQFEIFSLVSFDDEFVYYRMDTSEGLHRVSWDGAKRESVWMPFPDDLYKVEDDNYYCVSTDYNANTMAIHRYSISNENNRASCILEALPLNAIKDGWAYFFKGSTIYKIDINSGKKVNLANLPSNMPESQLTEWFIIGNSLYFKARSYHKDNAYIVRIYRAPLSGGEVEFSNVEWVEYVS